MNRQTPLGGRGEKELAVSKRQGFFARFCRLTGFLEGPEDTAIFLLVAGLFLHWAISVVAVLALSVWILCSKERFFASLGARRSVIFIFSFDAAYLIRSLFIGNFLSALIFAVMSLYLLCSFWLRAVMTRVRFERILDLSVAFSFYQALYGVVDMFFVHADESSYLMQSNTNNANFYGLWLVFLILAALFRLEESVWRQNVPFYLSSVVVNFVMLLFTESVASYFGLILGLLLMLFLYRHYRIFTTLLLALFGVFVLGFYLPGNPWNGRLLYPILERVAMWKIAWESICDEIGNFLFGQGLFTYQGLWDNASHSFWDVRGIVPRSFQPHSHNLFLEMLLTFGFVGFSLLLLYFFAQLSHVLHRASARSLRPYGRFTVIVCMVIFCSNLADASIFWVQNAMWILMVTASVGIPADNGEKR